MHRFAMYVSYGAHHYSMQHGAYPVVFPSIINIKHACISFLQSSDV